MGSTYISLTNRLLRRLNEVEISQSDFPSARGIQSTAKDAILDSIRQINNHRTDWPFNAADHTETLVVGQEEYDWPYDFAAADWESFQIIADGTYSTRNKNLKPISKDNWYNNLRDIDDDAGANGRDIPSVIFPSHGNKWGVSPSPNETYSVNYRYYKIPDDLVLYDDTTTIPTRFDYVILAGAMLIMNPFKGDSEAYDRIKVDLQGYLRDMTNQLLPNQVQVYVNRMNPGGGSRRSHMWTGYNE